MTDLAAVTRLIEPEAKALGFDLVRVAMIGGTSDPTLQIMAERPDTRQLRSTIAKPSVAAMSELLESWTPCRDPIEEGLSPRSQLARHRPPADPPLRLRGLGRA